MNISIYYNIEDRCLCDSDASPITSIPELAFEERPVWDITLLKRDGTTFTPSGVTAYRAAVAFDFNASTAVPVRTLAASITASNNIISVPVDSNTTAFLSSVSGKEKTAGWFELAGYDTNGVRIFYLIFQIIARMVLDPNSDSNVPEAPAADYLTATQTYAIMRAADELQFNTTNSGDGHTTQTAADLYYRRRNSSLSGVWSPWIELPHSAAAAAGGNVSIIDSGNYFTGDTVEAALQEVGATLNGLETLLEGI